MATWADVRSIALRLPETSEQVSLWERPLHPAILMRDL